MEEDCDGKMIVDEDDCGEWLSWDRLIWRRQVLKRGVWNGESSPPIEGSISTLSITLLSTTSQRPSAYLSSPQHIPFNIVIGQADTLIDRLIDRCVRKMWVGEECLAELLDGSIVVKIELLSSEPPLTPVYALCPREKLERASQHKKRGGELFRMGPERVEDALARFRSAARLIFFARDPSSRCAKCGEKDGGCDVEDVRLSLLAAVCNNMALCQLKQQVPQPNLALELCSRVLSQEPCNVKCLMRRAQALGMLNRPGDAVEVLQQVLRIEPNNAEAKSMMATMRTEMARQRVDDVCLAKKMLSLPTA